MITRGTTVTRTVIDATKLRFFVCAHYDVTPPLTFNKNEMAVISPSKYVPDLSSATEASSLHVTTKYVMSSSTLLGEPFPLTAYAANPSSTRAA